jgi:hypothetical protein
MVWNGGPYQATILALYGGVFLAMKVVWYGGLYQATIIALYRGYLLAIIMVWIIEPYWQSLY